MTMDGLVSSKEAEEMKNATNDGEAGDDYWEEPIRLVQQSSLLIIFPLYCLHVFC